MFKELSGLANLMKNAQAMSGKMQEMREKLGERTETGSAGGGMVSIDMNGHSQALACRIDPTLIQSGDREMLEDLVVAAVNQALEKIRAAAVEEMSQVTGGLDLPGLSDAFSKFGIGGPGM